MEAPSADPRDAPRAGLKVVELARILAGSWIGPPLAELGAEVVKVKAPDDCDLETVAYRPGTSLEGRTSIAAIGMKLQHKWIESKHRRHEPDAAITILNVAGMDEGMEQQTFHIDEDVALPARDQSSPSHRKTRSRQSATVMLTGTGSLS